MQDMAAFLLEYFDFDFNDQGMVVVLGEDPPELLIDMLRTLNSESQAGLVGVYECLSMMAESDDPETFEVDDKVCSMELRAKVIAHLRELHQG